MKIQSEDLSSAPRERRTRQAGVPYCRYHCVACGLHFASLSAFDQHRGGSHARHRFCFPVERLHARGLTSKCGICKLDGPRREDVAVFQHTEITAETRKRRMRNTTA